MFFSLFFFDLNGDPNIDPTIILTVTYCEFFK